jgi:hypothetical protein
LNHVSRDVVPFSFDLSSLAPRTIASLYSHLVTRPTGRALRLGIESQIGDLGARCLSVLDFTQVVVLDYSCADEAVAKLLQRFHGADGHDVYFVARGLGEQHREPIETVLMRHALSLVAEVEDAQFVLLGVATGFERIIWDALEARTAGDAAEIAATADCTPGDAAGALDRLAERRVVLRNAAGRYYALSGLLGPDDLPGPAGPAQTAADD